MLRVLPLIAVAVATLVVMITVVGTDRLAAALTTSDARLLLGAVALQILFLLCVANLYRTTYRAVRGDRAADAGADAGTVALAAFGLTRALPGGGVAGGALAMRRFQQLGSSALQAANGGFLLAQRTGADERRRRYGLTGRDRRGLPRGVLLAAPGGVGPGRPAPPGCGPGAHPEHRAHGGAPAPRDLGPCPPAPGSGCMTRQAQRMPRHLGHLRAPTTGRSSPVRAPAEDRRCHTLPDRSPRPPRAPAIASVRARDTLGDRHDPLTPVR